MLSVISDCLNLLQDFHEGICSYVIREDNNNDDPLSKEACNFTLKWFSFLNFP